MRFTLVMGLFGLALTTSANAETATETLQRCAKVDNDIARLQCFDALAQQYAALPEPVAAAPAKPVELTPEQKEQRFGLEHKKAEVVVERQEKRFGLEHKVHEQTLPEQLVGTIAKVRKGPYGRSIFTLENNQIWKQKDGRPLRLNKGDEVVIDRGVLNAFYLHAKDSNRSVRVTREN